MKLEEGINYVELRFERKLSIDLFKCHNRIIKYKFEYNNVFFLKNIICYSTMIFNYILLLHLQVSTLALFEHILS